jgi:hypothetical protein
MILHSDPSDVAASIHSANGVAEGTMESIRLPSILCAGFDGNRYSSAHKPKNDRKVRIDAGIALPRSFEIGLVDEIAYFRYKHLHGFTPAGSSCVPDRLRSSSFGLCSIQDD